MTYIKENYRHKISLGQSGNSLMILVAINLIVFIIFAFVKALYLFRYADINSSLIFYYEIVINRITLPAEGSKILARPWTILTHMFLHEGIWHLLPNMIWLGFFGSILQTLTATKKLIPVFIYGGLAGAVAFILAFNFLPGLNAGLSESSLSGASAGIMAVAIVTTIISPGYRIFPMLNGGIPLWIITSLFLVIDLATIPISNPGVHIAHLAGAFMGFLFMFFLRRGYDWSEWMNNFFEWVNNLFNPDKPRKSKEIKNQLVYKSGSPPYKKFFHISQQHIDEILDKINQKGYEFLTEEEKDMLKQSREKGV